MGQQHLSQAQFIREFNENYREEFNPDLFERSNEEIVEAIEQVVKSCERDKYFTLKLLSFKAIYDYEEIYNTLREHEQARKKRSDKTPNSYDYINIKDTDMILLKLEWFVRHNGLERVEKDGKTLEVMNPEQVLEVLIAIPRFRKKYYFRLSGNYYTTIFQIVDGSTYNNSTASQSKVDTVTMKTMFMPIRVFRGFNDMRDVNTGIVHKTIEYQSIIFNNVVNVIYYMLGAYGLYGCSQFLEIDCVTLSTMPNTDSDNYVCFEKHGIFISCPKICFEDPVVQSYVATIYDGIMKDTKIEDLFNQRYWLRNLGMAFKNATVDKGLFVLDSIDGIYDNITKRDLHLPEYDKANIYCILRWIIREFSHLRTKDNVDVRTKRIRIADYIAAIYANKLNKGMYRVSDMGSRVTLKKVIQAIYTQPMYVMNKVSTMSNLVSYRDMVNDMDSTVALKCTYKGISGLGEDGASVQPVYRYVDPSHIGILDLDASSASDPGMTGMLCPMTNLEPDHSFTKYEEPNTWRQDFAPLQAEYKKNVTQPVSFDHIDRPEDIPIMEMRDKIVQEELDLHKIICPISSINDPTELFTCSKVNIDNNVHPSDVPKSLFTVHVEEKNDLDQIDDDTFILEDDE